MKFFAGSSNKPLAEKIVRILDIGLSPVDVHVFPDGERRIRISEPVVGEHAFVLQSANTPVDTNYMELFFLIDALKRNGAEFVTALVPYFGYQRQDHIFRDGEAVSLEVMIRMLESLRIDRLISFDMHSVKIPDLFSIPVSHLSALSRFAKEIERNGWYNDESILVSPDEGGITRIQQLSRLLSDMPYVVIEKERDLATGELTSGGIMEGSLAGKKRAIMVDDMIASGKTMMLAAEELKKQGVDAVHIFATHALFSGGAPKRLEESAIGSVFVTDTVQISEEKQFAKLKILTVADIIARDIKEIMNNEL